MNEEAITTVNDLKKAHAVAVIASMEALKLQIKAEPEIWFGGEPPLFDEVNRFLEHRATAIRETFGLEIGQ